MKNNLLPKGAFLGLSTIDLIFSLSSFPVEDSKNTAKQFTVAGGGPATNAAVAFSFLGGEASLISSIGNTHIGNIIKEDLNRYGVRHFELASSGEKNPALSSIAVSEENGSRTIFTSPEIDSTILGPFDDKVANKYLKGVKFLLLDGHQIELALFIADKAKGMGIDVILDGDLFQDKIDLLLNNVDVVIFGKTFSPNGMDTYNDISNYLKGKGVKHIVATNGNEPVRYVSNNNQGIVETSKVSVKDTLAAGDIFHGAFCFSWCKNRDIESAVKFASRVAGASITSFGTRNWMNEHQPSQFSTI